MSRILKRPMFRIGGQANEEGIVSMAAPRRNYAIGSDYQEAIDFRKKAYREAAGPGPSKYNDLGDMLISGGLNILSGKSAGKGTLGAVAESFKEPYAAFAKSGAGEDAFQRQLDMAAVTSGITSVDAERLARIKLKQEGENEELITLTKLYQASGNSNPYAMAKTQIDFKKKFNEDIAPFQVTPESTGKFNTKLLENIPVGQIFLTDKFVAYRKIDDSGNTLQVDKNTGKNIPKIIKEKNPGFFEKILTPPNAGRENPYATSKQKFYDDYYRNNPEKRPKIANVGD
jgi:hypothetical protein